MPLTISKKVVTLGHQLKNKRVKTLDTKGILKIL